MTENIVLVHGVLGFGDLGFGIESQYFRWVANHYRRAGHQVLVPGVPPLGPIADRSLALARALQAPAWAGKQDIIVLAHSMGGLDIRQVVFENPSIAHRIKSIVTIATPLFGSPVADAVLNVTNKLRNSIPLFILELLSQHTGAIDDLQTRSTLHAPDVANIKYIEIGCVAEEGLGSSPFFDLAREIAVIDGANDGVVTLASAKNPRRELAEIWNADHGEAVGWPTGVRSLEVALGFGDFKKRHLDRYDRLLSLAK